MRNKRRRTSLKALEVVEEETQKWNLSGSRSRRRKSSLKVLSEIEKQNGIDEQRSEVVAPNVDIPCAQSNECAGDISGVSKHGQGEGDCSSDVDLFGDIMNDDHKAELPSSPVLATSFTTPNRRCSLDMKSTTSIDWGGDESLIAKCSEELFKQECRTKSHQNSSPKNHKVAENDKEILKNTRKDHSGIKNDSVFGDIDLSSLENQITTDSLQSSRNYPRSNTGVKTEINAQLARSPLISTTMKSSITKHVVTSPKCAATTGVDDFVRHPSRPIAASTPSRTPGSRKGVFQKITERLKANANQQTANSFHFHEAAKAFSDIIQDADAGSQGPPSQAIERNLGPFYGLPLKVKELMHSIRGIKNFYEWQDKCLTLLSVLQGKNLIYSLPTSGGKTLVAEMLIMKELLCKEKDAILVLPFVAIVQEKVRNLAQFADALDFLVEEYAGSKGRIPPTKRRKRKSLFICTIEKANSLISSLIDAGRLDSVGLVVVDELHMLGEGGRRGATIEMMLAKVMHVSGSTQIIGMSATLSNIQDLAKFLRAEVYTNDFRPVALEEHVKCGESIYKVNPKNLEPEKRLELERVIDYANKEMSSRDTDHLATMVLEVIPQHSCLIFCPTKKNCENVATMICKLFPDSLKDRKTKEKLAILDTLYQDSGGAGVCPVLSKTVPFGVAYHHSGLTSDERRLVEEAYNDGVLCVIACTSTLAAGVNLPARRVIIRSPYVGRNFLSRSQYKQMVGRAGRAGIDTKGESYLILTKAQDKQKVLELVTGPVETCISSLMYDGGKGFKTMVLNLISLKIMTRLLDAKEFFNRTLISVQLTTIPDRFSYLSTTKSRDADETDKNSLVENVTKNALQELLELKLIRLSKKNNESDGDGSLESTDVTDFSLEVTKLGVATNRGSIDFAISNIVYDDLKLGLRSLVLVNYLHLLYLVTPHDAAANIKPNWMLYFEEYGRLTADEQTAASVIGVPENFVAMKAAGHRVRSKKFKDEVISRFYVTLMLYHLFRGRSVWDVSARFEQPRGFLQTLLTSSAAFASCVLHFTKELEEFWPYHALLEKLIQCLQYCTTAELLPLMEIPGVKIARAKQLYNAGYKTLAQVAKAEVDKLVRSVEHLSRRQALQITASAKVLLKEKVEELQAEAEELQTIP